MKRNLENQKGITLIALIVTIIVLLILAGISIVSMTGDNGIITKANEAKGETEIAKEREAIELNEIKRETNEDEKYNIGVALYDKTIENANKWDIIIVKDPKKTYGTNWKYVEKGTKVENYGETKYAWLVNEETGETIMLADDEYTRLTNGENLGVTDGLILNIDPSIIENTDVEDLKEGNTSVLGKNVELKNFNWTEESGLTPTTFNFDGKDDYIKIEYDNQEEKDTLAKNGFTFEYYGKISDGTSYNAEGEEISNTFKGIFCYWDGNEKSGTELRFGMVENNSYYPFRLKWNSSSLRGAVSDYSEPNYEWNILFPIENFNWGDEIYYTITLDTSSSYKKDGEEYYTQTLYINGQKLYQGGYNKKQWENFINNSLGKLKYFCIGRATMGYNGWWHYSKMNAYTLRLYNKALTSEEVKSNYDKSVAYHESISK